MPSEIALDSTSTASQHCPMARSNLLRPTQPPRPTRRSTVRENEIVHFLRKRDYRLIRELGQGACGKTVLLHDDLIDEAFVCKKYVPYAESERQKLFESFVREIK